MGLTRGNNNIKGLEKHSHKRSKRRGTLGRIGR